jgi:hypothetical protein
MLGVDDFVGEDRYRDGTVRRSRSDPSLASSDGNANVVKDAVVIIFALRIVIRIVEPGIVAVLPEIKTDELYISIAEGAKLTCNGLTFRIEPILSLTCWNDAFCGIKTLILMGCWVGSLGTKIDLNRRYCAIGSGTVRYMN